MRKPIIAGNWKMHKTVDEAVAMVKELAPMVADVKDVDIVVCPTFTSLYSVNQSVQNTNIAVGAQNIFWEEKGAFTGEIAPNMLKDMGCKYVLIGHSERRQYFGETDETVNKRTKAAIKHKLTPIVCVGETLAERESNQTEIVVKAQVVNGLEGLSADETANLVIAYEPVWAIGTGRTASADDANSVCAFIRTTIAQIKGQEAAAKVRIQYGGSVKPDNVKELMAKSDIDGALVGGASLEAKSFSQLVKF